MPDDVMPKAAPLTFVRYPIAPPYNAYFNNPDHRAYLIGHSDRLDISTMETVFRPALVGGVAGIVAAGVLYALLPTLWLFSLLIGLLLAFALPSLLMYQHRRWINSNAAQGTIIEGEIVASESAIRHNNFVVTITYTFNTPREKARVGTVTRIRPELMGEALPPPRTPVYILYFPTGQHYLL